MDNQPGRTFGTQGPFGGQNNTSSAFNNIGKVYTTYWKSNLTIKVNKNSISKTKERKQCYIYLLLLVKYANKERSILLLYSFKFI